MGNDLKLTALTDSTAYSRLPLLINFIEFDGKLNGSIHFNTNNYSLALIEIIVQKYEKLLHFICEDSKAVIGEVDINLAFENENTIDRDFNF